MADMDIYKHDIELDAMKKIESRRADRIQDAYNSSNNSNSTSHSNSNSDSNGNRNRDSLPDRRVGNVRERGREGLKEGGAYSHQSPYDDPYGRNDPPSSSGAWDKDRDRDSGRDIRRGDAGREGANGGGGGRDGGRGGGGDGSHARSGSSSLRQGNITDDEVSKLDQTLLSDR